jgi:L-serine dehydratase
MRAAGDFVAILGAQSAVISVRRLQIDLYGSLAVTGKGHGIDGAILLGLCGEVPDRVDPETIEHVWLRFGAFILRRSEGFCPSHFMSRDLIFHNDQTLQEPSNAMHFGAFDKSAQTPA